MNTNNIKRYAPKARTAFIAAMTKRAALFGIREPSMGIEPLEQKGDLALIGDRPFPASIIRPRAVLVKKIEQIGFAQAMEQAAYSWFNRLCAIRYMELKGYLDHGRRVLSHPDQPGSFQLLDDCLDIDMEGLDKQRIAELKLDGTKDEELYRELLLAQCHALHQAMPFLFEAVDDATELLLPDNLTKTDSLIRELISAIPEEDWHDVEIIGWLYQFYISEKKEQVIGKVVKSEDIPAATQLFTPNWIVQYLVQNSVGRQWLQTYPDSPLKGKMPYYIEPAEQTSEVQAQLTKITPESIDPLTIKVLDPACGSGHILVEAYKVLKEIYTERGHRSRDIPQLILENNLFGLDIDDRAGQLAGFALMMLAREDDRRIFDRELKLNILALQESRHLDLTALWQALNLNKDWQTGQSQSLFGTEQSDLSATQADSRYQLLKNTLARCTQAKTFGSLIEAPAEDAEPLGELMQELRQLARDGDSLQKPAAQQLIPFVQQAWILALRFDAVVANPPYMGSKGMNTELKTFAGKVYPNSKSDLFAIFIERGFGWLKPNGFNSMVTMQSWMFLSSYEKMREKILARRTIENMVHMGNGVMKIAFGTNATVFRRCHIESYRGFFSYAENNDISENGEPKKFPVQNDRLKVAVADDFKTIPGSPVAYWASKNLIKIYTTSPLIKEKLNPKQGMATGDNELFLRFWWEVNFNDISLYSESKEELWEKHKKYARYNKGGDYKKWYGNNEIVINFTKQAYEKLKQQGNHCPSENLYFKRSLTWSDITTKAFAARLSPEGAVFDVKGSSGFPAINDEYAILGLLCSKFINYMMGILNPSVTFQVGDLARVPFIEADWTNVSNLSKQAVETTKKHYDLQELSYDFNSAPLLKQKKEKIRHSFQNLLADLTLSATNLCTAESRINEEINKKYGLDNVLPSECSPEELTLEFNPKTETESKLQSKIIEGFVSYAIGCITGRYSLDREGLVYAHAGNHGFTELAAEGAYKTFPADSDGILPLTDQEWFADDATNRFREFVRTVWEDKHLQENLDFVAESLCLYAIKPLKGKSGGESALDTIRRYLSTQFYKDHLKTYKKRPIYWLFSSGKHKAFECLVYLHRYNEGTLARMRTEYVIPLTAKLNTYANKLATDIENETVTFEKKRLEKELATLHNQQAELATFDEKLRHHADQRISLDLDDGVKVNYGKFGDLLAEVKAVTGDKGD